MGATGVPGCYEKVPVVRVVRFRGRFRKVRGIEVGKLLSLALVGGGTLKVSIRD